MSQLSDITLSHFYSIFTWVGIVGTGLAFSSMVALYFVGNEIDSRKDARIAELKETDDAKKEYYDVAILNMIGKPQTDGDLVYNTPIPDALEGSYEINGTYVTFKRDAQAEKILRNVIALFPKFPFSYWAWDWFCESEET